MNDREVMALARLVMDEGIFDEKRENDLETVLAFTAGNTQRIQDVYVALKGIRLGQPGAYLGDKRD